MRPALVLTPLLALALLAPATAYECTPTTSRPEVTLDTTLVGGPTYYVDDDTGIFCLVGLGVQVESICSTWVYEESNGIPGLQRGDEVHDDTCGGRILSDTIVL